jgi:hypothetical protein
MINTLYLTVRSSYVPLIVNSFSVFLYLLEHWQGLCVELNLFEIKYIIGSVFKQANLLYKYICNQKNLEMLDNEKYTMNT